MGKFGQRNEQNNVNMVIVMSKFVAKYGGYCRKLGKNMVDIDGYLADMRERI